MAVTTSSKATSRALSVLGLGGRRRLRDGRATTKLVSADMKKKVDAAKADIISGKIKVADYMAANACRQIGRIPRLTGPSRDQRPAPPRVVEMIGIHKRFGAVRQRRRHLGRRGHGARHRRRERRRQVDADVDALRLHQADAGEIRVDGQPPRYRLARWRSPGIGMVHQHFMLVDTFTALENIMLGAEPARC